MYMENVETGHGRNSFKRDMGVSKIGDPVLGSSQHQFRKGGLDVIKELSGADELTFALESFPCLYPSPREAAQQAPI